MKIGIPVEKKVRETRVGMLPTYLKKLVDQGHEVNIQKGLAVPAGISDSEYEKFGAKVVDSAEELYSTCDFIVKFKDFTKEEYGLPFKEGQIIFTAFHLGEGEKFTEYTKAILNGKITGIAVEQILKSDGTRACTDPMGEVAGRMAPILGAQYAQRQYGGRGVSMSPITGLPKPKYLILGGGHAGLSAAQVAKGFGAEVTVFEKRYERLEFLRNVIPECELQFWDKEVFAEAMKHCDVLINCIYAVPGMEIPFVTRNMVKGMKKGAVIIDLEGCGLIETSRYTTIDEPTYIEEGVVHFCVDNIPAMVPDSANGTWIKSTFPYVQAIANKGITKALEDDPGLKEGVIVADGHIVNKDVSDSQEMEYTPLTADMLKY